MKFITSDRKVKFAEVFYFTRITCGEIIEPVAVVSLYSDPHAELLSLSSRTYYSVKHLRDSAIKVIPIKSIQAVVAAVPDAQNEKYTQDVSHLDRWQIVEKPGLKLDQLVLDNGGLGGTVDDE